MKWLVVLATSLVFCGTVTASSKVPSVQGPECYGCASSYEKSYNEALIYRTFGRGWQGQMAVCIARRESGMNHRAFNHTDSNGGSVSLFQINGVWWSYYHVTPTQLKDPRVAVRIAYRMSGKGTQWSAWGNHC